MNLTCLQCEHVYEIAEGSDLSKAVCPQCKTPPSNFFVYSRSLEFEPVDGVKPITVNASNAGAKTQPYAPGQIPTPERIGKYEILGRAGAGGMGVVYRARDLDLNRTVALKVMIAGEHATEDTIGRFQREARSAAKLTHPGIVHVYDVGNVPPDRPGGAPIYFFAMEFVEGRPIDKVARDPGLAPKEAARIASEVARALAYAHEQGVVHRDVKPGNILLDAAGRPHLVDFGLAKEAGDSQTLTKTGDIIGTACYMPPEQASGDMKAVDAQSDIYALGTVLYEMLTRRPPFIGETMGKILRDVEERDPDPPTAIVPSLPRELETICLKAMAKEKHRRYATAAEFADDLDRFLAGEPILARRTAFATRASKWARRHPAASTAGVMLCVFVAAGLAVWFRLPGPPPPPPPPGPTPMELLAKAEPHYLRARAEYEKARKYKKPDERKQRITVYTRALEEVDLALGVYAKYAEAFALRGLIRVALNQPAQAMADFDRAVELKPALSEVYYERIVLRITMLQLRMVRVVPMAPDDRTVDLDRERPLVQKDIDMLRRLQINRAQALVAEARFAIVFNEAGVDALALVNQALDEDPTFPDAYVLRADRKRFDAVAMRRYGDRTRSAQMLQEALDDCNRAIDEDANHREAYKVRADVHLALGRRAQAVRDVDEMVAVAPDRAQSYVDRAMVLMPDIASARTRSRVLDDLERALWLDPEIGRARFLRGAVRLMSREAAGSETVIAECRADFETVLKQDPQDVMAHTFRLACDKALLDPAFDAHFQELCAAKPDMTERERNGWHIMIQQLSARLKQPAGASPSQELLDRGQRLAEEGKAAEAEAVFGELLKRLDNPVEMSQERVTPPQQRALRASACYETACIHAERGSADRTVAALEQAIRNGRRAEDLEYDPNFENVRSRPEFRDLMARHRK